MRASRPHRRLLVLVLASVAWLTGNRTAAANDVVAAVAANFTPAMQRLARDFERRSGHHLIPSPGATGALYAQIRNGAPFDIFLAADRESPRRLEQDGLSVAGTRFTYAVGRLALWSAQPGMVDANGDVLRQGVPGRIAIANPKTAPYGAAAVQTLRRLGLWERLAPRLVQGENITQTFQFVRTGNAAFGFVALAQIRALPAQTGSYWLVPAELHEPLAQDAVLLKRGINNIGARAFLEYLRSAPAKSVIEELGYATVADRRDERR
ncbi:MAG: molybdate ABC transporter substrate-binding protein [Sulfurifustis sp.]